MLRKNIFRQALEVNNLEWDFNTFRSFSLASNQLKTEPQHETKITLDFFALFRLHAFWSMPTGIAISYAID